MLMADTMSIFFVILGMMLAFPGLWLLCRGLWPGAVAAAASHRCPQESVVFLSRGIAYHDRNDRGKQEFSSACWGRLGRSRASVVSVSTCCKHTTGVSGLATSIGRRLLSPLDEQRPGVRRYVAV